LWVIESEIKHATLTYDKIEPSIPIDVGVGKWKNVEIPFNIVSYEKKPFNYPNFDVNKIHVIL